MKAQPPSPWPGGALAWLCSAQGTGGGQRCSASCAGECVVDPGPQGQDTLDQGLSLILDRITDLPELQVACFATNSRRRPSQLPPVPGVRVTYLASAGQPLRTTPYQAFPRPGVVIGDQVATDGILARRLGYTFLHCSPHQDRTPTGPRLMYQCGRLIRPLLFTQPA